MARQKDTHIKLFLTLLAIVIFVKWLTYNYQDIRNLVETRYYESTVAHYATIDVKHIKQCINSKDNLAVYIGSKHCGDCRYMINRIDECRKASEKQGVNLYYNSADEMSKEERDYLKKQLKIANIPTILFITKGKTCILDYENIISEKYLEQFKENLER